MLEGVRVFGARKINRILIRIDSNVAIKVRHTDIGGINMDSITDCMDVWVDVYGNSTENLGDDVGTVESIVRGWIQNFFWLEID